jgi:hypothetical protein
MQLEMRISLSIMGKAPYVACAPGVFIVEVDDGRIVSEHSYWDQVALLTQLGLMPAI